jgi:protein O-mannosyl-transferase
MPRLSRTGLAIFLLVAAGCCVYGRLVAAHFVAWDDPDMLFENPALQPPTLSKTLAFWTHATLGLYTPLPYVLWSEIPHGPLDLEHGAAPYHVLNIVLHLLASICAFLLLKELTGDVWPAWVGAMVFMLHPLQVEPVAWAAGMNNLLCGTFAIAALWQYVLFAKTGVKRRFAWATVLYLCALLCKPTAVVLPLIVVILDRIALRRPPKAMIVPAIIWLCMAAAIGVVTHFVQPASEISPPPLQSRPLIAADAIGFYVTKLFAPVHLVVDYERTPQNVLDQPWLAWPGLAVLFVGTVIWLLSSGKMRWLRAPLLIVPAALLPVLGLTPFDFQAYSTVADRYCYLAMIGVALFAAQAMCRLKNPLIAWTCAAILLVLLAARSFDQAAVWHDTETLARQELRFDPDSSTGHKILAHSLSARKQDADAESEFLAALAAFNAHPQHNDGDVWFDYANLLLREHRFGEAETRYRQAIGRLSPNFVPRAYNNLGVALVESGNFKDARQQFLNALNVNPDYAEAKKNLELLDGK